jgi:D-sedoheptulose 7-phosphate isomerase
MTAHSRGTKVTGQRERPAPALAAAAFGRRTGPGHELAGQAAQIVAAAHAMAVRFHQGGKLLIFGTGAASTDAQHVAVEFVHPVIVGKRALPAISLTSDVATVTGAAVRDGLGGVFAHQLRYLAEPADIALGISPEGACPGVVEGLRAAKDLGMLTVALVGGARAGSGGAAARDALSPGPIIDHLLATSSRDPRIVKEIHVSMYHLLWELVHVFFEQPGVLGPGTV